MLSVLATPIGNLGDITLRAIETLKKCDAIVCEDTRVTGLLLQHLGITGRHGEPAESMTSSPVRQAQGDVVKKELISFHGYSDQRKLDGILERLQKGEHIVLVSDAGTPGISDPGYAVVSKVREAGIEIEAIPGVSAVIAALSISGLPINHYLYLGFLPLKKGRQTLLKTFAEKEETIVFYESVHRIEKTLCELHEYLASQPNRRIVVARELTKMHEEIVSTTVDQLPTIAKNITKKGEFVVMIGPE